MSETIWDLSDTKGILFEDDEAVYALIFYKLLSDKHTATIRYFNYDSVYYSYSSLKIRLYGDDPNSVLIYADGDKDICHKNYLGDEGLEIKSGYHILWDNPKLLELAHNLDLTSEEREALNTLKEIKRMTTKTEKSIANTTKTIAGRAKEAGTQALKVEAGRAILGQARPQVLKVMPKTVQLYVGLNEDKAEPILDIIIASAINAMAIHFANDNTKALLLSEATMFAAMQNGAELLDLPSMLDSMLNKLPPEAQKLLDNAKEL